MKTVLVLLVFCNLYSSQIGIWLAHSLENTLVDNKRTKKEEQNEQSEKDMKEEILILKQKLHKIRIINRDVNKQKKYERRFLKTIKKEFGQMETISESQINTIHGKLIHDLSGHDGKDGVQGQKGIKGKQGDKVNTSSLLLLFIDGIFGRVKMEMMDMIFRCPNTKNYQKCRCQ